MEKTIIPCTIIILLALLGGLTLYKIENMPEEKVCHNFDKTSAEAHVYCKDYNAIEKVRYVWHPY